MSKLSHTIRKFNRFELKYVLTLEQAARFKGDLRNYLVPDEHGDNNGLYSLSSLYYDSPELRCYWEKENGIKFRRKLRMRRYESGELLTEETPIFLEIKQRVDRVTQKRRAVLPYGEALRLCQDRQMPNFAREDQGLIEEIFAFLWQYNLRPATIVRYDRQAFLSEKYDIGLRVTFDTSLTFQTHPLHLHEYPSALPMLAPYLTIMEIKVNERIPSWLAEMIAMHNLQLIRVSKYCRSIDAAQNMPVLPWRRPLAESSRDVLASAFSHFSPPLQRTTSKKQR